MLQKKERNFDQVLRCSVANISNSSRAEEARPSSAVFCNGESFIPSNSLFESAPAARRTFSVLLLVTTRYRADTSSSFDFSYTEVF